jgi:hypothetical protein
MLNLREAFYSSIESIADSEGNNTFVCAAEDLIDEASNPYGITIASNSLKMFLTYLIGIHQQEPLFSGSNILLNINSNINPNESLYYEEFNSFTTIDSNTTFKFSPSESVANISLGYSSLTYQGEADEYAPFGFNDASAVDTKLTATRSQIVEFFTKNYRSKFLRGSATFSLPKTYDKGYVIELLDKNVYLVVVSMQFSENGVHDYEALVLARG